MDWSSVSVGVGGIVLKRAGTIAQAYLWVDNIGHVSCKNRCDHNYSQDWSGVSVEMSRAAKTCLWLQEWLIGLVRRQWVGLIKLSASGYKDKKTNKQKTASCKWPTETCVSWLIFITHTNATLKYNQEHLLESTGDGLYTTNITNLIHKHVKTSEWRDFNRIYEQNLFIENMSKITA